MITEFAPTKEEIAEENRIKQNRETIIKSLAEHKYQSSRHLCINTGLSIDDVLTHVETDGSILYKQVGEITVYFLKENEPTGRLYNTGNNSFEVKTDDEKPEIKTGRQGKHNWTPQMLETLAAENYSYSKAAKSLGVDLTTIRHQVLKNKENTEAWERGQKRFQKPNTEKAVAEHEPVKSAPKPISLNGKLFDIEAKIREALEKGFWTVAQIAADVKADNQTVFNCLAKMIERGEVVKSRKGDFNKYILADTKQPVKLPHFANCSGCDKPFNGFPKHIGREETFCDDCVTEKAKEPEVNIASVDLGENFEHAIELAAENGRVRNVIKNAAAEVPRRSRYSHAGPPFEPAYLPQPEISSIPDSVAEVSLSSGNLAVAFEGNLFQMNGRERQLLNDIVDLLQEYKGEL